MRTTTAKLLWLAAINVFVIAANDDQPFDDHEGAAHLIDVGKDGAVYGAFTQHAIGKFEKPELQDIQDLWENWYKDYLRDPEGEFKLNYKPGQGRFSLGLGITEDRRELIEKIISEVEESYVLSQIKEMTDLPSGDGSQLKIDPAIVLVRILNYMTFRSHGELFFAGMKFASSHNSLTKVGNHPLLKTVALLKDVVPDEMYKKAVQEFIDERKYTYA